MHPLLPFTSKRHDFEIFTMLVPKIKNREILVPKFKTLVVKFKFLALKCQDMALNPIINHKIQIKQIFVPLKPSRFVHEKVPSVNSADFTLPPPSHQC